MGKFQPHATRESELWPSYLEDSFWSWKSAATQRPQNTALTPLAH